MREGRFREDLLYRLRVVPMSIPPLRERIEDVRTLALHFVERYARGAGRGAASAFPTRRSSGSSAHDWPGNVRELENAIKRALVLSTGDVLTPEDFDFLTRTVDSATRETSLEELVAQGGRAPASTRAAPSPTSTTGSSSASSGRCSRSCSRARRATRSARPPLLGINRNTLRKKITELGIELPNRS